MLRFPWAQLSSHSIQWLEGWHVNIGILQFQNPLEQTVHIPVCQSRHVAEAFWLIWSCRLCSTCVWDASAMPRLAINLREIYWQVIFNLQDTDSSDCQGPSSLFGSLPVLPLVISSLECAGLSLDSEKPFEFTLPGWVMVFVQVLDTSVRTGWSVQPTFLCLCTLNFLNHYIVGRQNLSNLLALAPWPSVWSFAKSGSVNHRYLSELLSHIYIMLSCDQKGKYRKTVAVESLSGKVCLYFRLYYVCSCALLLEWKWPLQQCPEPRSALQAPDWRIPSLHVSFCLHCSRAAFYLQCKFIQDIPEEVKLTALLDPRQRQESTKESMT